MFKRNPHSHLSLYLIFGLLGLVGTWILWRGGEDYVVAAIIGWAGFFAVLLADIDRLLMPKSLRDKEV